MTMGGLLVGMKDSKAKAPTRVMLMPASIMHRPQAQHRAGEGKLWGHRPHFLHAFLGPEVLELLSERTISLGLMMGTV